MLEYVPNTFASQKNEIYRRVFRYLDTSSDWQYSLLEMSNIPQELRKKMPEYLVWQKKGGE